MKILTFTSLYPNPAQLNKGIFIQKRISAIDALHGVDVKVVAPVPYYPDVPGPERWRIYTKVPHHEVLNDLEVFHPRYALPPKLGMSLHGVSMFLSTLRTVKNIYRYYRFDLIDSHYVYPDGFAAVLLGRVLRKPVVVSARGTDINVFPTIPIVRSLVKYTLRHASALIAVSESLKEGMVGLGIRRGSVNVIPNGIEPKEFFYIPQDMARKQLRIPTSEKVLLSIGNLVEGKGTHLLIEALAILKSRNLLDFKTVIIGKGELKEKLQSDILSLGLEGAVMLLGEVPNNILATWYNAADLFFLGSSREGWPNVICESLACGTPVISTAISDLPALLKDGNLGIVTGRSPEHFATAIQTGFSTSWDRFFISQHGQRRRWELVAHEVYDVYRVAAHSKGV